ncbi:MutS family DNA mismatch repair protein [Defluviitalea saccharophila]|uniref:DNA mismatch repair protein MutS n=1 Tax=Defluviitalea saccharophila TaxID=879970 RepID=A0ABZ2Y2X2_9FIRM
MDSRFIQFIKEHEASLKKQTAVFNFVGYVKLVLFLILIVSGYSTLTKGFPPVLIGTSLGIFIVFLGFWMYQDRLHEKIDYLSGVIAINNRHLDRISGKWDGFSDIGEEFIDPEHPYGCDLDIVGKKSLFQFLNRTHTWYGRHAFAKDLLHPSNTKEEIQKRQETILELSKDIEFTNQMEYYFSKIGLDNTSTPDLVNNLKDSKPFIPNNLLKFALIYAPVMTVLLIAFMLIFKAKNLYLTGATLAFLQALLWALGFPKTQMYLGTISNTSYKLAPYGTVIETLKDKKFHSEKLIEIQTQLSTSEYSAAQAIKDLDRILSKLSVRNNLIIYFILNVFLLWDYQCAFMLEAWKAKYAHLSEKWFLALGEFESLMSFSTLESVCNNFCMPAITDKNKTIEARDLGHPLLPNETRVNNDFSLHNNIFIISGSNMSGKTTFLRTVGINLVLAQAGSFVCAKEMTFSPLTIMTSMRIVDDLNEGISTFYAELKRIKTIIETAKNNSNMIFLIDEIFRGTNSVDRLIGAKTVVSKLNELNVAGLITTHDLELCNLANIYPRIDNYNFSEYYRDNTIYFDYKIKPGKSNTTNAKYLMKMIGII